MLKPFIPKSAKRATDQDRGDGIDSFDALAGHEEAIAFSRAGLFDGLVRIGLDETSADYAHRLEVTSSPDNVSAASSIEEALTINEGVTIEIDGPSAQSVTFTGLTGTLKLDNSAAFGGQVTGIAGSDAIDLVDISFTPSTRVTFSGDTAGGTLTITDGVNTANIALQGNYLSSTWTISSDGVGGTLVVDPVPAYNWQSLKIGGGGWATGLDIAPDGTMVARTDSYGAYIWNGSQWQQLVTATSMPATFVQPYSAAGVYEVRIAPSNSNIFYMMYEGFVFKSADKGATWTQTSFAQVTDGSNDPYRMNGQKMAIDPNNPNVVYVGTPQNGLFVTKDGGVTWQSVSAVPFSQTGPSGGSPGITGIMFDPAIGGSTAGKTNTIFASSYGNGVYKSSDGGISWTKLAGGPTDVENAAVSPTGVYYAVGNNDSSLWSYANGAWTQLNVGTDGVHAVAVNPQNPNEIVAVNSGGNLNVSYDGGATWSGTNWNNQLNSTDIPWLASTGYMSIGGIAFSPLTGNLVASDGVGVWNTSVPQNLQWNTPVVWNDQSAGIENLVANEIVVAPGGQPVLASWDRGFFYVADPSQYAVSYGPVNSTFVAGWSVDYASSNPNFLVGLADWWGTEQSGYSTDGGVTWKQFSSMPPFVGQVIGGTIAASSPTDIVWAPSSGKQPYYTTDGGASWKPVVLPGVTDWSGFDWAYYLRTRTVTADRVLPDTFYLYYDGKGVFKTTDGGANWTKVFNGSIEPFSGANSELESVPGQAGNLFFTGGPQGQGSLPHSLMRSTDGGGELVGRR